MQNQRHAAILTTQVLAPPSQIERYEWGIKLPPKFFKEFLTPSVDLQKQKFAPGSLFKTEKCRVSGQITRSVEDDASLKIWFRRDNGTIPFEMGGFKIDVLKEGDVVHSQKYDDFDTETPQNKGKSCTYYAEVKFPTSSLPDNVRVTVVIIFQKAPESLALGNSPNPPKLNVKHPLLSRNSKATLEKFWNSKILSDVVICCEGEDFPAHRLFLSMSSPVFLRMFESEAKEAQEGRVVIEDMTRATVRFLLEWIYSGALTLPDFANVVHLFKAAHKYCIDPLKNDCVCEILQKYLNMDNILEILALGHTYEDTTLLERAKEIVTLKRQSVFKNQKDFQEFVQQCPEFLHELFLQE